jgi:hypothetical protein
MNTRRKTVGPEYYTAGEVKELLGITNGILYNYGDNGTLEKIYPPGSKQAVYKKSQVNQLARELQIFIATRKKNPTDFLRVTNEEEMRECQEISQALFGVGRNTVKERMEILKRNPDTYHMLRDDDQVIGYLAVMPLQAGKLEKVLNQVIPVQINSEDIDDFKGGKDIDLYLHAIGVRPVFNATERHSYGARLISGLMDMIIEWGENGVKIGTIAARSNMPDGIRLMKHMGFTEIERLTPERRTFIIDVKSSGIPFMLRYKKALEESNH